MATISARTSIGHDADDTGQAGAGPVRIDRERLLATFERFATFGATEGGGLNRLSLGDEDGLARDELCTIARHQNYRVDIDPIGNVFITRPGRDETLPVVLVGSHLDSQPFGGRYDGTYGVLAGLEALRSLDDAGITTLRSVTLVDWTDEEGARFSPSLLGSGVVAGTICLADALTRTDANSTTVAEELERLGYRGSFDSSSLAVHRSFEAHIEQGPILERTGTAIAVVTGVQGIRWFDVVIVGQDCHAGTTPHPDRRDALVAAAGLIEVVDQMARTVEADLRATVGEIRVQPNSRNVIPGRVTLAVDLRHPEPSILDEAEAQLRTAAADIAAQRGVTTEVRPVLDMPPTAFDADTTELIRSTAAKLGYSTLEMSSGAGHDSMNVASRAPASMLFIPCVDGLSHTEAENIREDWAVNGAEVLLGAVRQAADEPEENDHD